MKNDTKTQEKAKKVPPHKKAKPADALANADKEKFNKAKQKLREFWTD